MPTLTADPPSVQCRATVYRIYADGREFGIDYSTRELADEIAAVYRGHFPGIVYTIIEATCLERSYAHGRWHEYVSLMTPCLHCPAAISWHAEAMVLSDGTIVGEWRDSTGTTGHLPDPSFL